MPRKNFVHLSLQSLESRWNPASPDLAVIGIDTSKIPEVVVPGDQFTVDVKISNVGDDNLNTTGHVHVYLNVNQGPGAGSYCCIGETTDAPISLGVGDEKTITCTIKIDPLVFPNLLSYPTEPSPGHYYVQAYAYGTGLDPNYGNNWFGTQNWACDFGYVFGAVGQHTGNDRQHIPLKAAMGSIHGKAFEFTLQGAGTGFLSFSGNPAIPSMVLQGTDAGTTVARAKGAAGFPTLTFGGVTANSVVGNVMLPEVDLTVPSSFSGGLGSLTAHDLKTGANVTIASGGIPTTFFLHQVTDANIQADDGIKNFSLVQWSDTDATADQLHAPFINGIKTQADGALAGDFTAKDVHLTGAGGVTNVLEKADIAGKLSGVWALDAGDVIQIDAGSADGWSLTTAGKVKEVKLDGGFGSPGNSAGNSLQALTFGNITVGGAINADSIKATGQDPNTQESIHKLKAGAIDTLATINAPGGIPNLETGTWVAPTTVNLAWIGNLKVSDAGGSTMNPSITLAGANPKTQRSLNYADINVTLAGAWNVADDVGVIDARASKISGWTLTGTTFQGPSQVLGILTTDWKNGGVQNVAVKALHANELDTVNLDLKGTAPGSNYSIKDLRVTRSVYDSTITLENGANSIMLGGMGKSTLTTPGDIVAFKIKPPTQPLPPLFFDSNVQANSFGVILMHDAGDSGFTTADFGISAKLVLSYIRFNEKQKLVAKAHLATPGVQDQNEHYKLTIV